MAQLHWNYTSNQGQQYVVGLYHGPQSGHFIAYCNSAIIIIDFNVKNSKSYSFFLDNDLCHLKIQEENQAFSYDFDVEMEANPSHEEAVPEKERYMGIWAVAGLFLLGLSIFLFSNWMSQRNQKYISANLPTLLAEQGESTWAKIHLSNAFGNDKILNYSYIANGKAQKGAAQLAGEDIFPIRNGDVYQLTFLPDHPEFGRLNLSIPGDRTIERLKVEIARSMADESGKQSSSYFLCQLDYVEEKMGSRYLAHFYHRNTDKTINSDYNRAIYQAIVADDDFQEQVARICMGK